MIRYYDHYIDNKKKQFMLVVERCDESLADFLKKRRFELDKETMMRIVIQILEAVTTMHSHKTVHRDIK